MASVINIKILGEDYPIKATTDEKYLKNIVRFVDGKMTEVKRTLNIRDDKRVAILASLNIADDLFKQKRIYEQLVIELEERIKTLDTSLEF